MYTSVKKDWSHTTRPSASTQGKATKNRISEILALKSIFETFAQNHFLRNICFQLPPKNFLNTFRQHPRYLRGAPNLALHVNKNMRVIQHTVWILCKEKHKTSIFLDIFPNFGGKIRLK